MCVMYNECMGILAPHTKCLPKQRRREPFLMLTDCPVRKDRIDVLTLAATTHGYRDSRTGPQQREWRNYHKKAWRERAELGL